LENLKFPRLSENKKDLESRYVPFILELFHHSSSVRRISGKSVTMKIDAAANHRRIAAGEEGGESCIVINDLRRTLTAYGEEEGL